MEIILPPCSLHSSEHAPDRAVVRNDLGAITAEAMAAMSDPELIEEIRETVHPNPVIKPYAEYVAENPERYQRVTTTLPAFINAAGRFTHYYTAPTVSRYDKPIVTDPFIPIGEYGEVPARRLLIGVARAISLAERVDNNFKKNAVKSPQSKHAILHHTYQGYINGDAGIGLAITMQQGMVSTGQSIAMLSPERVPNYKWDNLATDLVERDKVTELARGIGSGLLPFFSIFGRYVTRPIRTGSGTPALTSKLRQEIRVNRDGFRIMVDDAENELPVLAAQIKAAHTEGDIELARKLEDAYNARHLTASAGTACPAANRQGEVTQAARLILRLMSDD